MKPAQTVRIKHRPNIASEYWLRSGRTVGVYRGFIMVRLADGTEVGFREHELEWGAQ